MNYSNHNLRTQIQEWKNRLYRSTYQQFGNQIKFTLTNLEENTQIKTLLSEASIKYIFPKEQIDQSIEQRHRVPDVSFFNEMHQAAFCHDFLKYIIEKVGNNYNLHSFTIFRNSDFDKTRSEIIEDYFTPIFNYLHDRLDKINSTIFLLEKYKRRTEWFKKAELNNIYNTSTKNYEQIFEDDLRLFLFDQGIDYPFSTPLSASGRGDIIGEIETDDPLIIEIKIFDRRKGYGKDRIKDGFSQIIKYANDYNKDVGYLVIYNLDNAELNFKLSENKIFPPSLMFNGKIFYFIVINCYNDKSASKSGTTDEVVIIEEELTKK